MPVSQDITSDGAREATGNVVHHDAFGPKGAVHARRRMSTHMHFGSSKDISRTYYDGARRSTVAGSIDRALKAADDDLAASTLARIKGRAMVRPNHQLSLKIVLHEDGHCHYFYTDITAGIRFLGLKAVVKARCERWLSGNKFRLVWLQPGGEVVEMESLEGIQLFAATMWCSQPWTVHVVDERTSTIKAVTLTETARSLFDRYDVNFVSSTAARTWSGRTPAHASRSHS